VESDTAEARRWVLQDSKAVFTIYQHSPDRDSPARGPSYYYLGFGPPSLSPWIFAAPEMKIFKTLLFEAMQDPTRNTRYELDAEKCAQIAQSLWLSILPL
jgi:hypothetical protein